MELITVYGTLGLLANCAIFILIFGWINTRNGLGLALLVALTIVLFGVPLVILGLMLIGIPWQFGNVLFAACSVAFFVSKSSRKNAFEGLFALWRGLYSNIFSSLVIALFIVFHFVIAVLKPELSIDGQLYHGPVLASIISEGTVWGWTPVNQYYFYTDLTMVQGINLATFTGVTRFDDALQVPHLLLFVVALVWVLKSRFKGLFPRVALAVLVASAPVIWLQPRILYVDLAYGVAIFLAIVFISQPNKSSNYLIWLVTGISIAGVIATKPSGLLAGISLAIVAMMKLISLRNTAAIQVKGKKFVFVICLIVPILLSASFYLRNLVSFNNPIYPVQAKFGPISFPGIVDLSVFASGDRGNGVLDLSRIVTFINNIFTGSLNGVLKPDYDPREGGFGYVPIIVFSLVVLSLVGQLLLNIKNPSNISMSRILSKPQIAMVVLALLVLALQPSTFDARYVIGPTAVLLAAVSMSAITIEPNKFIDFTLGSMALLICVVQVGWNETHLFPGLKDVVYSRAQSADSQPSTPGNPWGISSSLEWLPQNSCQIIGIQTQGGLTSSGMSETSYFATLPYALYGDHLCNKVVPVSLKDFVENSNNKFQSASNYIIFNRANYLLLNVVDTSTWMRIIPHFDTCFEQVNELTGNELWPESVAVFVNQCN